MPNDTDLLLNPQVLTTQQLAAYLQLPPKTVTNWRYQGGGPPSVKLGRHVRYRWVDIQDWLESLADPLPETQVSDEVSE
jgi:excisionase family DNA binding protein